MGPQLAGLWQRQHSSAGVADRTEQATVFGREWIRRQPLGKILIARRRSSGEMDPSTPRGDVGRYDKGGNPPYQPGLDQERRVTLIRHEGDFELAAPCQHRIQSGRGQQI